MDIKTSQQLQEAIVLAKDDSKEILYDIARYIAYNYYMHCHIKKDSQQDLNNDMLYKQFKQDSPELYKEVEQLIDMIYEK